MTRALEWLLGLEHIRLERDAPLLLRWESSIEAWIVFVFGLLAAVAIAATYRAERLSRARRVALATIRCGIVALVVIMLCRPALVLQRNKIESSHVALVLDASLSMATQDAAAPAPTPSGKTSRLQAVQDVLLAEDATALRRLLELNAIQLYTFAGSAESSAFAGSADALPGLAEAIRATRADGVSTDLARAIEHVIEKGQGRRLAAVVLASDGRATQPTSLKDAIELAAGRQVPIYPVRVGSQDPVPDVEVGPLRAQDGVFVNDLLAVEAQLSARGLTQPTSVRVNLIEDKTGNIVAFENITVEPSAPAAVVELRTKLTRGGSARFRVEAVGLPDEHNMENNVDRVDVTILEGGLRVLYVEGYPRYEYRYLKNALLREPTLQLSAYLLEADEQFVQEGAEAIRRFPDTPEELGRFDLILFGDVDPRGGWLTAAQMNMLLDFVGHEGGGFGLIAGERAAPHRFLGTPLERLLPVAIDPGFQGRYDAALTTGFDPRLTPEGRRNRLLRFTADREANVGLLDSLPELFWIARTLGPKPGASVLLEHPTLRTLSGSMPVVVTGRYGAGKLFFQATDDTWRWRRHTGELLHDTYWIHVVRELMRDSRGSPDRRFVLRTDRRTYPYGVSVRAEVQLFDPQLLGEHQDRVEITASEREGERELPVAKFDALRISPQSNVFEGIYVPPRPGGFSIEAGGIAPLPGERSASVLFRVDRPDVETRRPEADHETLGRIAAATGGRVLDLSDLTEGLAGIRDRSVQIPDDVVETLWDSKLVWWIFLLMISMEWGLRKAFGLL